MKGRVLMYWCDLCGRSQRAKEYYDSKRTEMPKGWKQIGKEHVCEECAKEFEARQRVKARL